MSLFRSPRLWIALACSLCAVPLALELMTDLRFSRELRVFLAVLLVAVGPLAIAINSLASRPARDESAAGAGAKDGARGPDATQWTVIFLGVMALAGCLLIVASGTLVKTPTLLWAFAALSLGGVTGFLFAIPRVLQGEGTTPATPTGVDHRTVPNPTPAAGDAGARPGGLQINVNTNLEQISDWLTKIIVGLGLVELRNLPTYLRRTADFMAPGLIGTQAAAGALEEARASAAALLIFFTLLGFLSVYTVTRLYIARQLALADLATVQVGETRLTPAQAAQELVGQVLDIRQQLTDIGRQTPVPPTAARAGATPVGPPRGEILWVEEGQAGRAITKEEIRRISGVRIVDEATTTAQALVLLRRGGFGLLVTDMARTEGLGVRDDAGLVLAGQARQLDPSLPIVILTNAAHVDRYRQAVSQLRGVVITSSAGELMAFVKDLYA